MSKKDDRIGETRVNNDGEEMRIIRYGNANDIDVRFEDGTVVEHKAYYNFLKGQIKNPYFPSFYGVGFIGNGKFKPFDENGKPTKCYIAWKNMMKRCYCLKCHKNRPRYSHCTVDEKWWNFQVFAEWYYSHYYEIENEKMALDKDILKKGNNVYSAETCVFVPSSINNLFVKSNKTRGDYPIGVTKHVDKFVAQLTKDNEQIYLGIYPTPEEAFLVYKQAKETYIKEVANKYKEKIRHELYEAMMNYNVEIDD